MLEGAEVALKFRSGGLGHRLPRLRKADYP